MCDVSIREYILRIIGRLVHKEVKMLCSDNVNSILKEDNPEVLKSFTWQIFQHELSTHAPIFMGVLESASVKSKPSSEVSVCLCAALIARSRTPTMTLPAKILSLVLYAGHSSKEVYIMHYLFSLAYIIIHLQIWFIVYALDLQSTPAMEFNNLIP